MSMRFRLSDIASRLDAEQLNGDVELTGVSIDTRSLSAGDLYVAIVGERFDGHDFVAQAEQAGAAAVLSNRRLPIALPQLVVADTRQALAGLANWWSRKFMVPTVAITGSNGKTTVKEMVASILAQIGPVLATEGNLNNDIGVPLTLLRLREHHQYAVIEMGANHAGEIAELVKIAVPDVALVNNVAPAHLEGFGSIDAVAAAKSEIYGGLDSDGWAIINADDAYADVMRAAASHCKVREFGLSPGADVRGIPGPGLQIESMGTRLKPRFSLVGDHNGRNALAAVAVAECLYAQATNIVLGLEAMKPVAGRLQPKRSINGARLIDDSYNANPESVRAAINVLMQCEGQRHLVLGDMAELGADAPRLHAELGQYAKQCGLDGLWTIGVLAGEAESAFNSRKTPRVRRRDAAGAFDEDIASGGHFTDQETLVQALRQAIGEGAVILVKGSRSARMERVVKALEANSAASATSDITGNASNGSEVLS